LFYAGQADLDLHRSETVNYRDNLASGAPSIWIALRPRIGEPPCEIAGITADPAEGECWTEPGDAIVEAVAMPEPIREAVAAFVKQHYVETIFSKRERDRADPEALARHAPSWTRAMMSDPEKPGPENPLARWSRRKSGARAGQPNEYRPRRRTRRARRPMLPHPRTINVRSIR